MTLSSLLPRPYRYGDLLARMRTEWPDECSDFGSDADDELSLMDETTHRRDTQPTRA